MKIFTGYFANTRAYREAGLLTIGIAVHPPKWYAGLSYKALAPRSDMLRMDTQTYLTHFNVILGSLNPAQVVSDLEDLSDGRDVVLLCFEALKNPNEICHRRYVAEWLAKAGYSVSEWKKDMSVQESLL